MDSEGRYVIVFISVKVNWSWLSHLADEGDIVGTSTMQGESKEAIEELSSNKGSSEKRVEKRPEHRLDSDGVISA